MTFPLIIMAYCAIHSHDNCLKYSIILQYLILHINILFERDSLFLHLIILYFTFLFEIFGMQIWRNYLVNEKPLLDHRLAVPFIIYKYLKENPFLDYRLAFPFIIYICYLDLQILQISSSILTFSY